jgi:hypothetical protein
MSFANDNAWQAIVFAMGSDVHAAESRIIVVIPDFALS